jgi:hypothetical protein
MFFPDLAWYKPVIISLHPDWVPLSSRWRPDRHHAAQQPDCACLVGIRTLSYRQITPEGLFWLF